MRSLIALILCLCVAACASAGGPTISGFIDASYTRNIDENAGEFGLNEVELQVIHEVTSNTSFRADVDWTREGNEFVADVEQAWVAHTVGCWTFKLGKFNAPVGFEDVDAPDLYQYSFGLVSDYGAPDNLTGLKIGRGIGELLDASVFIVNGWDQNANSNRMKTFGGRLDFGKDALSAGVVVISGKEKEFGDGPAEWMAKREGPDPDFDFDDEPEFKRTMIDVELAYEPEGWVFGGEVNLGFVKTPVAGAAKDNGESPGEVEQEWFGFLLMAHRSLTDVLGLTLRYDYFDDKDGYAFPMVNAGSDLVPDWKAQTRQAVTVAPTLSIDKGLDAVLEFRMDMSSEKVFQDADGKPKDSSLNVAFGITYSW